MSESGAPDRKTYISFTPSVTLIITRYLEYEVFKEHADKVCFITPDVTQFIKLYEGEVTDLHDLGALISFYPVRH